MLTKEKNDLKVTLHLRQRKMYERMGRAIFFTAIKKILERLPYDSMTVKNYESMVRVSIGMSDMGVPMKTMYLRTGLLQAEQTQRGIDQIFKAKKIAVFNNALVRFLTDHIRKYMGEKIISMSRTLAEKVIKAIAELIEDENPDSIRDISNKIKKKVLADQFYKWEVERIVRTETTNAANMAAWKQAENSPIVLEKIWLATPDERVRTKGWDHLEKHDTVTDFYERWEFINHKTGEKDYLLWAGEDGGQAGNVINCRCAIAFRGKRDANGNLIMNAGKPRGIPPRSRQRQKPTRQEVEDFNNGIVKGRSLEDWENAYRHYGKEDGEMGAIYNDQGVQIYGIKGKRHEVVLTKEGKDLMFGNIFTHNHPNGYQGKYGGSFSNSDVESIFWYKTKEFRAVDAKYLHSMKFDLVEFQWDNEGRNPNMKEVRQIRQSFKRYSKQIRSELSQGRRNGEITREYADENWIHLVWERWVKKSRLGKYIDYTRTKI